MIEAASEFTASNIVSNPGLYIGLGFWASFFILMMPLIFIDKKKLNKKAFFRKLLLHVNGID